MFKTIVYNFLFLFFCYIFFVDQFKICNRIMFTLIFTFIHTFIDKNYNYICFSIYRICIWFLFCFVVFSLFVDLSYLYFLNCVCIYYTNKNLISISIFSQYPIYLFCCSIIYNLAIIIHKCKIKIYENDNWK